MAKKAASAKAMSKSEVLNSLADSTGLNRKQVSGVLDALSALAAKQLGKKGPGVFAIPGLAKCRAVSKPAVAARKGIDPFTKQERMFKAKPASTSVRIRPLKKFKDSV